MTRLRSYLNPAASARRAMSNDTSLGVENAICIHRTAVGAVAAISSKRTLENSPMIYTVCIKTNAGIMRKYTANHVGLMRVFIMDKHNREYPWIDWLPWQRDLVPLARECKKIRVLLLFATTKLTMHEFFY